MAGLNRIICGQAGANTGTGQCVLTLGGIVGGFLVNSSFALTAEQLASETALLAALNTARLAPKTSRIYPLPPIVSPTDNSEDNVEQTFGYGGIATVREGKYNWQFQYVEGGICVSNALRKFNSQKNYIIFFDQYGTLFGMKSGTSMKGIPLEMFWADKWKINSGSEIMGTSFRVVFDPKYVNDMIGFMKTSDIDLSGVKGLYNVVLKNGVRAAGVLKLTATYGCGGDDLYDLYDDEIADVAAWVVTNTATGNLVTISSVAKDTNIKGWTVTVDTADPDYTADAGGLTVSLAAPSVLATEGVDGFESNSVTM